MFGYLLIPKTATRRIFCDRNYFLELMIKYYLDAKHLHGTGPCVCVCVFNSIQKSAFYIFNECAVSFKWIWNHFRRLSHVSFYDFWSIYYWHRTSQWITQHPLPTEYVFRPSMCHVCVDHYFFFIFVFVVVVIIFLFYFSSSSEQWMRLFQKCSFWYRVCGDGYVCVCVYLRALIRIKNVDSKRNPTINIKPDCCQFATEVVAAE